MSIKCGSCGGRHPNVQAVRACASGQTDAIVKLAGSHMVMVPPGAAAPGPEGVLARLRRQAAQRRPTEVAPEMRQYTVYGGDDPAEPGRSPLRPAWAEDPSAATAGAVKYATDRLRLRAWEGKLTAEQYATAEALVHGANVDKDKCSNLIDALGRLPYRKDQPVQPAQRPVSGPPAPDGTPRVGAEVKARVRGLKRLVPDSRYAVEVDSDKLRFFWVKTNSKGYLVIKEYASDTLHDRRFSEYEGILTAIVEAGPEAAQTRFGQELGQCYHCYRALTDETSRSLGIGPVCRNK